MKKTITLALTLLFSTHSYARIQYFFASYILTKSNERARTYHFRIPLSKVETKQMKEGKTMRCSVFSTPNFTNFTASLEVKKRNSGYRFFSYVTDIDSESGAMASQFSTTIAGVSSYNVSNLQLYKGLKGTLFVAGDGQYTSNFKAPSFADKSKEYSKVTFDRSDLYSGKPTMFCKFVD
jgi:hypothetical protein